MMHMKSIHKLIALLIVWAAIAAIMIFGDALALSVTGIGMVVPIILVVTGASCTKFICSDGKSDQASTELDG